MNMTADRPLILLSFFEILALIAFSFGMRSASTRFCASDAVSTPEPAFSEVNSFCAADLFAFWISAAVAAALVVELTGDVAMVFLRGKRSIGVNRQVPGILEQFFHLLDVIEQVQLRDLRETALRRFQRQHVLVHLGDRFGVVDIFRI